MQPSDDLIRSCLKPYDVSASPVLCDLIRRYLGLLRAWNRRISLTSIVDTKEILQRHFGEGMFAARALPILNGRLADVGSGGGFPGLPLKLIVPDLEVSLIESNPKKVVFLREVVRALDLSAVVVIRSRFEDFAFLNSKFDYITARALGRWAEFLKWAGQALTADGSLILWLGGKDADELSHARGWSWRRPIAIPNAKQRVLLVGRPKH